MKSLVAEVRQPRPSVSRQFEFVRTAQEYAGEKMSYVDDVFVRHFILYCEIPRPMSRKTIEPREREIQRFPAAGDNIRTDRHKRITRNFERNFQASQEFRSWELLAARPRTEGAVVKSPWFVGIELRDLVPIGKHPAPLMRF
ncbi:MAG TPA: hypothetical protein VND65_19225 [Candidatus Binatia bacterium]|nr:hypothetical protein [Candidatus Binatia bacterium]